MAVKLERAPSAVDNTWKFSSENFLNFAPSTGKLRADAIIFFGFTAIGALPYSGMSLLVSNPGYQILSIPRFTEKLEPPDISNNKVQHTAGSHRYEFARPKSKDTLTLLHCRCIAFELLRCKTAPRTRNASKLVVFAFKGHTTERTCPRKLLAVLGWRNITGDGCHSPDYCNAGFHDFLLR